MANLTTQQETNKYLQALIPKLCACADLYKSNLEDKNFMLVYSGKNTPFQHIELRFKGYHFLHLTGVQTVRRAYDAGDFNLGVSALEFYQRCLSRCLSVDQFYVRNPNICNQKLDVLPSLIQLHKSCKMIGEYNYSGPLLETDLIIGNVHGAVGYVKPISTEFWVPNTVLKKDARNLIPPKNQRQVTAILRKGIFDKEYTNLCYIAKGININLLANYLKRQNRCQTIAETLKTKEEPNRVAPLQSYCEL